MRSSWSEEFIQAFVNRSGGTGWSLNVVANGSGSGTDPLVSNTVGGTGTAINVNIVSGGTSTGTLQIEGGVAMDTTLRNVADQAGTNSPLQLSTTQAALTYAAAASNTYFEALLFQNTTAATSGNQQYSPATVWSGRGWKTTATAASQVVSFMADVVPVQGASQPYGYWRLQTSINSGTKVLVARADISSHLTTYDYIGNTTFGYQAGNSLSVAGTGVAFNNVFIGGHSGQANTDGYQNTFVGNRSGALNTTGYENTFIGQGAGYSNVTGVDNTFIGFHAGLNSLSDENTYIGLQCGQGVASSGGYNSAFGARAFINITTGYENVGIGRSTGQGLTTGYQNVFAGVSAGLSITTGFSNVIIGWRAGYTNVGANAITTGSQCIFIGEESGYGSSTQAVNVIAIGYRSKVSADNTAVFGNTSIVKTIMYGTLNTGIQSGNAGLSSGDLYYDTAANILANGDKVIGRKA